jgi:hypothetical protein
MVLDLPSVASRKLLIVVATLLAMATALAAAVLPSLGAQIASAATPACYAQIAGTYFRSSDFVMTLSPDKSLVGQYSPSTQDAIGLEESFSGRWTCSGNQVALQSFHFLMNGSDRLVERGNAIGTFNGYKKISLTYTFHVFPEDVSADDLRDAEGDVVNVPTFEVKRVSQP